MDDIDTDEERFNQLYTDTLLNEVCAPYLSPSSGTTSFSSGLSSPAALALNRSRAHSPVSNTSSSAPAISPMTSSEAALLATFRKSPPRHSPSPIEELVPEEHIPSKNQKYTVTMMNGNQQEIPNPGCFDKCIVQ